MTEVATTQNMATAIYELDTFEKLQRIGEMMASGKSTVPRHLQGNPADCTAVATQAYQWGMNPFAVAQKTHLINGTLGYEAQLVVAVINARAPVRERLNYEWEGNWTGVNGKTDKDESRACIVTATMNGEAEPRVLRISMAQVGVRNSPLWVDDPRQQLAYLAAKRWARLHCPDVILGVYTPDEIAEFIPADPKPGDVTRETQSSWSRQEPATDAEIVEDQPAQPAEESPQEIDRRFSLMVDEITAADDLATLGPLQQRIQAEFQRPRTVQQYNDLVSMWKARRVQINTAIREANLAAQAAAKSQEPPQE